MENNEIKLITYDEKEFSEEEYIKHSRQEKSICTYCGNDSFKVFIRIIIDDAVLFCAKCGKECMG